MYRKAEEKVCQVQMWLANRYGYTVAEREMYPLRWYVDTERASYEFCKRLVEAKTYMLARKLHQGGSVDEAIDRIKSYLEGR